MSSDMKDARWALAHSYLEEIGLEWENLTYDGRTLLLDTAQRKLDKNPQDIPFWAENWRKQEGGD